MRGLNGKAAIVTGGCHGIGRGVVEALIRHGVNVTCLDLSEQGKAIGKELSPDESSVQFVAGDVSEDACCQRVVQAAARRWGRLDFLVNNAFSFIAKGMNATREDWQRMLMVGPVGYATMVQHAAPVMATGGGGAIVNISSISAHIAQPQRWTYNAAKGAVNQLTRCMALDLAPSNIRVNTVSPGWIWTREVEKAAESNRDKWGPIWGRFHMLRRLGEIDEVAAAVVFLLSDEASFITAAELPVDGGYLGLGSEGLGDASSFAGSQ